jgi:hypothetical protein
MTDERDYIDKTRNYTQKLTGESSLEALDEMIPSQFALYGLRKRAAILDAIDAAPKDDIDEEGARAAFDKEMLRRHLGEVHETLRKAGR